MNEHNAQTTTPVSDDPQPKIVLDRSRAVRTITLNRPRTLNALDREMCKIVADEIPRIARNPDIYIVTLLSSSPKAFCAGGDVLALTAEAERDIESAKAIMRAEYELDWLLECFSKPTVSFIDGICMGSGAGLTAYNTHRVAGENYKWAMPEVKIGLFPDVGIANVLARLPWPIGLYLGLTGRTIRRDDAQWLGLITHCIASSHFPGILAKLADAEPVDPLLDGLNEIQGEGPLQKDVGLIRDHFSHETLSEIFRSLIKAEAAGSEWARDTLTGLRKSSPVSLAITDRHIRNARTLDIRETLIEDYRLAVRCLENPDFFEGVRSALRDKDGAPKWSPVQFEAVTTETVESYFAPLGKSELTLASRVEMQAARV
ncbi:enoyl-CoA hydratase/isomerase family protein [Hyphomicrobium sp.]|uniref:enoyl-CoA hydratase/isomerase family protein n=1 Tax=Hyphomicrobium sp. TaxID=82 RepID=UPI002CCB08B2|nr:enoyl-CoA hydratase/isomerase family protein [Hyphomicrobium sp.]HVZ04963.1 enoyl-CoA hydratase/isomerase family protein [Hyphomicrobium sp.]